MRNPFAKIFSRHNRVAIDIDDTLIGNNGQKYLLREAISDLSNKVCFFLLTFREGCTATLAKDLFRDGINCEFIRNFRGIIFAPKAVSELSAFKYLGIEPTEEQKAVLAYWKPLVCKKLSITLLVDDRSDILDGPCEELGIEYVNPLNLV